MPEGSPRCAIIFASGMEEKTISRQFAPEEEGTLLEYVLDSVWTVADELLVVFQNEPKLSIVESLAPFGVRVLTTTNGSTAVDTILHAFKSAKSEHCLLATEAVPLLKPNVVLSLFENAMGYDLAIPRWKSGKTEPMLAVYRCNTLVRIANSSSKLPKDVKSAFSYLAEQIFAAKYVSVEDQLEELDPELDSFLKVEDETSLGIARSKAAVKMKKTQG